MRTRTFNAICILAIVAVGAMAMFMVQASADRQAEGLQEKAEVRDASSANPVIFQPLSLGLSLAVVADVGLMTVGLVILFKDDAPVRDRPL